MMKWKIFNLTLLLTCLLALLALGGRAVPVSAAPLAGHFVPPPAPTVLYVPPLGDKDLGAPMTVYALLRDDKGGPLSEMAVYFYIDFIPVGQSRTDANGVVTLQINKKFPAGEHVLLAQYFGGHLLDPSFDTSIFQIKPAVVHLQTIPPVAGVAFNLDGREFVSGKDGSAQIEVSKVGKYHLEVHPEKYSSPVQHIEFGRWEDESFQPYRDIDVPGTNDIQVGLNIFYQAGLSFKDLEGSPVDPQRITKITIKSAQGDAFSFTDGSQHWIPASRVARRLNGLEVTRLQYSVMNVTVDGSNVVNQAQQRFYVDPGDVWPVSLLLYSMRITTKDALFGTPVGRAVRLDFPNGQSHTYTLDAAGTTQVHSLARGIYHIQVTGVTGMISPTPVALSRDQEVSLKVITSQDIALTGAAALAMLLGLLLVGRPWLVRWLWGRRPADPEPVPQPAELESIHNN